MDYHPMSFISDDVLDELLTAYKTGVTDWLDPECASNYKELQEYVEAYLDELYDARAYAQAKFDADRRAMMRNRCRYGHCFYERELGFDDIDGLLGSAAANDISTAQAQIDAIERALFAPYQKTVL